MRRVVLPATGVVLVVWRAAVVFRVVALALDVYLIARWRNLYAQPAVAFAVGAAMVVVTIVVAVAGYSGRAHRVTFVVADLVVTVILTLLTPLAQHPHQYLGSMPTLTTVWAAGPVLEAGILLGALGGLVAALLQFAASVIVRQGQDGRTLLNGLLLLVAGGLAGYVASLAHQVEDQLAELAAERARQAEHDRLTRPIHDGVLQVLALVHRRGLAAGGEWAELGAEAAAQEVALRALVSSSAAPAVPAGTRDLAADLTLLRAARVHVARPDRPVVLPAAIATEVLDAVRAAMQNVEQHAGPSASTWILLERLPDQVTVSVRDDGVGMADDRLTDAVAQGRLGVAESIRGRIADLGGTVQITTSPGAGTEIEMTVPA